jgi:hypothetical protein
MLFYPRLTPIGNDEYRKLMPSILIGNATADCRSPAATSDWRFLPARRRVGDIRCAGRTTTHIFDLNALPDMREYCLIS